MKKVYITKEFMFEASHSLLNYKGACANLHGHSYKLQVEVSRYIDFENVTINTPATEVMVLDFKELKKIVEEEIIDTHDHNHLNSIYFNSTAEVMVVEMFEKIKERLPEKINLECVRLWETVNSFAEYRGE